MSGAPGLLEDRTRRDVDQDERLEVCSENEKATPRAQADAAPTPIMVV